MHNGRGLGFLRNLVRWRVVRVDLPRKRGPRARPTLFEFHTLHNVLFEQGLIRPMRFGG